MEKRAYIAIDLKSFYASVECIDRGLDPMRTHLVVADASRTEKTICLAVSPSLKTLGIPGRARLFEVVQKVKLHNAQRRRSAPKQTFVGSSWDAEELAAHPEWELNYLIAPPQMARYIAASTKIYEIYLKYVSPDDIHVYSIDEVFIDATPYLKTNGLTAREFAMRIILDILNNTGITATAGIGENLYLCKIAMDIGAKHIPPDQNGVRIAELDEMGYRRQFWSHRPLTDFWRVGGGIARKLERYGMYTMGDIARCSLGGPGQYHNEDLLYKLFGVNAELLIDHAWGWEPCTLADIKAYRPSTNSICSGQVLQEPYPFDKAWLVVREMADLLALDLVDKRIVTDQLTLDIGYDVENLSRPEIRSRYRGEIITDRYGRKIPRHAHGTATLERHTSSTRRIVQAVTEIFDRVANPLLLVRRFSISANRLLRESDVPPLSAPEQLDLFTDYAAEDARRAADEAKQARERQIQEALLTIKHRYGKNAILKGMNLEDGATARQRNSQIGGHKA